MRDPLVFNVVQISPMEVLTLFSKITLIQWLFLGLQALGQLHAFLHVELCTLSCECILTLLELSAQINFLSDFHIPLSMIVNPTCLQFNIWLLLKLSQVKQDEHLKSMSENY